MSGNIAPAPLSNLTFIPERFAFAAFAAEGVLLDLVTGALYCVNAGAALICAAAVRGEDVAAIERDLAQTYQLPPAVAARDVGSMLAQLAQLSAEVPPDPAPVSPSFAADADGFRIEWQGEPILRIDPHGHTLTYVADPRQPGPDPALVLKWAVPHVLALQHQPVLHASAVLHDGGILAFSGYSGAGKTTLARLFAANGSQAISEDLLVVSSDRGRPAVRISAEVALHGWAAANGALLNRPGPIEIDARGVTQLVDGPLLPLREILLIDRERRAGDEIATEPLSPAEALVALIGHGFAELQQRDIWIELLAAIRAIVSCVPVRRATMPDGLEALQAAVRRYSTTTAS